MHTYLALIYKCSISCRDLLSRIEKVMELLNLKHELWNFLREPFSYYEKKHFHIISFSENEMRRIFLKMKVSVWIDNNIKIKIFYCTGTDIHI